jgi:hypothetical protein
VARRRGRAPCGRDIVATVTALPGAPTRTALTIAHPGSLTPEASALLATLAAPLHDAELYLAGSAALALYVGHRTVRDLDLMAMANRLTPPERRDLLQALLATGAPLQVETARDGYLALRSGDGVAVRLYYYPYPLAAPPEEHRGDLGLMKLGAIISRGSRRDFVDLYLLCRALPLAELLAAAPDKFGHVGDFALQALKGLADLSEVEGEPMPVLATPVDWHDVEAWVTASVCTLGAAHVGLASGASAAAAEGAPDAAEGTR